MGIVKGVQMPAIILGGIMNGKCWKRNGKQLKIYWIIYIWCTCVNVYGSSTSYWLSLIIVQFFMKIKRNSPVMTTFAFFGWKMTVTILEIVDNMHHVLWMVNKINKLVCIIGKLLVKYNFESSVPVAISLI